MNGSTAAASRGSAEGRLPPVAETAVAALVLVIIGGIIVASFLPNRAPLGLPVGLLAAAFVLIGVNIVSLSRVKGFAWDKFFLVGRWALLAYVVIGGMLELVFILDQTPTDVLLLLTFTLLVFVIDIPMLFAFSVAKYQPAEGGNA